MTKSSLAIVSWWLMLAIGSIRSYSDAFVSGIQPRSTSIPFHQGREEHTPLFAVKPAGFFTPYQVWDGQNFPPSAIEMVMILPLFHAATKELTESSGDQPNSAQLLQLSAIAKQISTGCQAMYNFQSTSPNFQMREVFMIREATMNNFGFSSKDLTALYQYKADILKSQALQIPEPPMPMGEGIESLVKAQSSTDPEVASLLKVIPPPPISTDPFNPEVIETPAIREEYERLMTDQVDLMKFGTKYGTFDPIDKLAFLDQIDEVESRWDVLFFRFQLMNVINPEYKRQCDKYLAFMGMDEEKYVEYHKKAHEMMRKSAEAERDGISRA